jgi:ribosomal protein S12 methylthiotransferase accessory factor
VAAHLSWSAAVRHAVLEILERDLVWRSWYGTDRPVRVPGQRLLSARLRHALDELRLHASVLVIAGPAQTACVAVCLHTPEGHEQSFGARCVGATGPTLLGEAAEVAAYEALMVRWSMRTPVADRAWEAQRGRDEPGVPRNMLEHALLAFHRPDSLRSWLDRSVSVENPFPSADRAEMVPDEGQLASALAEHTGADVVAVNTTIPEIGPDVGTDGLRVVRVIAPGARQLPNDERTVAAPPGSAGHRPPPHPFG